MVAHDIKGTGDHHVVVLHGWFGDHQVWQPTYPLLDLQHFTYAFLDYRGYGASRDLHGDHSMNEMAQDAIGLADHLGWTHFSVVGHSMGGMAAQKVAIEAPARVRSVVGVTPVPATGAPLPPDVLQFFEAAALLPTTRRRVARRSACWRCRGLTSRRVTACDAQRRGAPAVLRAAS
jgi:pimeloyl-ACP methyl ester carboxylesterase